MFYNKVFLLCLVSTIMSSWLMSDVFQDKGRNLTTCIHGEEINERKYTVFQIGFNASQIKNQFITRLYRNEDDNVSKRNYYDVI